VDGSAFALAPSAATIAARLVETVPEFAHLADQRVLWVASSRTPMLRGSECAAFIATASVQGALHWFIDWLIALFGAEPLEGASPDYLVILDGTLWPALDASAQERLVFHELCHVVALVDSNGLVRRSPFDNRVLTKLAPHDFELFDAELRRYGTVVCGADGLVSAIRDGDIAARRRKVTAA
jgi:hypothetical protein